MYTVNIIGKELRSHPKLDTRYFVFCIILEIVYIFIFSQISLIMTNLIEKC
jgi:hypothetical protein